MNKKIHVLYTIPNFDTAGSGKVVYDLVKNINKDLFDISIVCNHNRGPFFKEIESLGYPIYLRSFTVSLKPYVTLLRIARSFKNFLKEKNIDVVHSWHWSSDWTEALSCKLANVPFVYTKKSMGWGNRHWKIKSYLSSFIVSVNPAIHNFFKFKKNVTLIPFGADTNYYDPKGVNNSNQPNESPFTIITVANLVSVKNIELIIDAVKQLKHLNVELQIVGDTRSDYAKSLQNLINEHDLNSSVIFKGKHSDVRPFLKEADVFVISSINEGMPMALVEAMAMALPVLGSDIPGISYVLDDFKEYLFRLDSKEELSTKIEAIFNMSVSERKKIGEQMRDYCINNLSMQRFIERHESLYSKVSGN